MAGMPLVLTVTQLNTYVKSLLNGDKILSGLYVAGEISNFTDHYKSGHLYMSLKDEEATIKAVMFRSSAQYLRFKPQSGMRVICRGRVSLYERDGQYQLYIDEMQPDGLGALYLAYEQTKKRLEAEGLFDVSRKKPLPRFPKRIAVITSPTGAARRDIEQVIGRRYPLAEILLYPSLVQGVEAPAKLANAVREVCSDGIADVMIIGRGGGSVEELCAFNDEGLAREIARSNIPVVSAVGHETDYSICDFVADVRAATPSVAAELVTPDRLELSAVLANRKMLLYNLMLSRVQTEESRLNALKEKECMKSPEMMLEQRQIYIDSRLEIMKNSLGRVLERQEGRFSALLAGLQHLSPLNILSRGYAIAYKENSVVSSVNELEQDDVLRIQLTDGSCMARVEKLLPDGHL